MYIIFDTETTGLDPKTGDRMVEIGCIEMVNRVATGSTFHAYFNPDRDMPPEAERVHGLSAAAVLARIRAEMRGITLLGGHSSHSYINGTNMYFNYFYDIDCALLNVELTGTAPDEASRARATTLAAAVDGVVTVDNRLTVVKNS